MALPDVYQPGIVLGSTDWTGGVAPAGGTHTGISTITMHDGKQYLVAHSVAEIFQKLDFHAVPPFSKSLVEWVAFDRPGTGTPIILQPANIASFVPGNKLRPSGPPTLYLGENTFLEEDTFLES